MAYTMSCKDTGMDCPGAFTTPTAEETAKHVQLHLAEAHPGATMSQDQVRTLIKSS